MKRRSFFRALAAAVVAILAAKRSKRGTPAPDGGVGYFRPGDRVEIVTHREPLGAFAGEPHGVLRQRRPESTTCRVVSVSGETRTILLDGPSRSDWASVVRGGGAINIRFEDYT